MSYCTYIEKLDKDNVHKMYHDNEYGFPLHNDNELFARLVLEINQAGLSWDTILKKKTNFYKAFNNFDVKKLQTTVIKRSKACCWMPVLFATD